MIDFWKDFDGTNSDNIPHLRVDVNKHSWWHGTWEYSGLDIERIKAYCKATGKDFQKEAINADFMNKMEEWYFDLAENYVKWIPVSEGLPEESCYCLCCDKDGYMTIGSINKYSKEWCFDDDEVDMDVAAWIPLPEPYKAESEAAK